MSARDVVRLVGVAGRGRHGVFEHERAEGQDFAVDVALHVDALAAGRSDSLADTVDYGALAEQVHALLTGEPVQLLEALAHRIALRCLAFEGVEAVDVAVHKPQAPIAVPFGDAVVAVHRTRLDLALETPPADPVDVVLALGANLGDPAAALGSAVRELAAVPGLVLRAVSPVVETDPVGGPSQPAYLNAVALAECALSARDLLDACRAVEARHGRQRAVRWGPRTLDVDVVAYGALRSSAPDLLLPHPRAHERAFVLQPWAAVDPAAVLDRGGVPTPVVDLLAATGEQGVRPRPDVVLEVRR